MRIPRDLWLSQRICCCFSPAAGAPCSVVCSAGSAVAFPGAPVFVLEVSPLHTDQTWCCLSAVIRSAHISRTGRNDIKTCHPTPSQMTCQEAVYLCVPGTHWGMCRQTGADWAGKAPEKCFNPVVTHSHCQGRSSALPCITWDPLAAAQTSVVITSILASRIWFSHLLEVTKLLGWNQRFTWARLLKMALEQNPGAVTRW